MRPNGFPDAGRKASGLLGLRDRFGKGDAKKRPLCAPEAPPSILKSASVAVGKAPPGMIALRWLTEGRVFMVRRCLQIDLVALLRSTVESKEKEPPQLLLLR